MKIDISQLTQDKKTKLINNLWESSSSLWDIVVSDYKRNEKFWKNKPDWLEDVPKKRSKARDNRTFLAMESVITTLTGRPSKPNVMPANKTDEARKIADDLQVVFLDKYKTLGTKDKIRRGLRYLFLSRLICLKVIWDYDKNDYDTITVDPRKVRFSKNATSMYDTKFAIEEIDDILLTDLLEKFGDSPEKETEILKLSGYTKESAFTDNVVTSYREAWIDGYVLYQYKGKIIYEEKHPYFDFDGVKLTPNERMGMKGLDLTGQRDLLNQAKSRKTQEGVDYESYLYNHFDRPIPPYVFSTVLGIKTQPIGETTLIDQVIPLQEEIDKRKRQISDNASMMNGQHVVDTKYVKITKAEAQAAKNDPNGMWYGDGVSKGIDIRTGKEIPSFIANDMNHSIVELDNIFGTQPTFRGEGGGQETATGRAILREQSINRLDELIDVVDKVHTHLYNWWFQMMKVKYTADNYVKPIGSDKADEVIELTQDDLQEGIEIRVVPGQIIQEDRLFKAERAKEEAVAGLIDPLTYFEETGRENPIMLAKRLIKFKINPLSIFTLDDQDMKDLSNGQQQSQGIQTDQKSQAITALQKEAEDLVNSEEFKTASPDNQERMISEIEGRVKQLSQS